MKNTFLQKCNGDLGPTKIFFLCVQNKHIDKTELPMAKSKHSRTRKSISKSTLLISLFLFFSLSSLAFTLFFLGPSDPRNATHRIVRVNEESEDDRQPWTEVLSWEPRVTLYHNFLTNAESDHLINISRDDMRRSVVIDSETGEAVTSKSRTSYGHFLKTAQDAIVDSIEKRIAEFTFIPKENGEPIQILRYQDGQEYKPHPDYFVDKFHVKRAGQRIATVLMYLSDVEEGGETVFPYAKGNFSAQGDNLSACARKGVAVKPRKGDALLFWSLKPDGSLDSSSIHVGCPVIKGTKWSATKWLHTDKVAQKKMSGEEMSLHHLHF